MKRRQAVPVLIAAAFVVAGAWVFQRAESIRDHAPSASGTFCEIDEASAELPSPTEHVQDEDAEARHREERRAWIEEMHRAAPGVDWRAIERENGERLQGMRNAAVLSPMSGGEAVWTEIGSNNLAGRMHVAALSLSGDSLYAGSSLGGVWKASLDGQGWRPVSDHLYGGSHGLAIAEGPGGVETITSVTDDGLVHYTQDGGATWYVPAGIGTGITSAKRVLSDPAHPSRVWLLLEKSAQRELYRSDDGGASYVLAHSLAGRAGDIWMDRVSGGALYLQQRERLLKTENAGASWDTLGAIGGFISNVVLTGSEAGAPTIYTAVKSGSQWKLYRSTDAGASFEFRYDIDDFWETLGASITDPDLVFFGGVELWRSTDGGASFAKVNAWYDYYGDPLHKLHADLPGLDVLWTSSGEAFYIATDGGLFRSLDGVATVTNISLEKLRVSQYYGTLTSVNDPDRIVAGAQDQGYQRSTGPALATLHDFTQLISGDYAHLTSSDGTHAWVYSVYPGFVLVQKNELEPIQLTQLDFPAGESYLWLPPILADPNDPKAFYFCARHLYRYVKSGSLPWQYYQETAQDFTVAGGSYLSALSISPVDTDRRIAVTNTGVFWHSEDGGLTWTVSPDSGPGSHYFHGTALEPSPVDANTAYAGGAGYSGPAVYRTTDGGVSWTPVSDGLPSTLVFDLVFENAAGGFLYAATEAGPYRLDPVSETWEYIGGTAAPITTYWCVEAVAAANVVRFGTYGRGIWDFTAGTATGVADAGGAGAPAAAAEGSVALAVAPNPFNPFTTLRYRLAERGPVSLKVFDATGRRVRTLVDGTQPAGERTMRWDGTDDAGRQVASGVYLARLECAGGVSTVRMTLAR